MAGEGFCIGPVTAALLSNPAPAPQPSPPLPPASSCCTVVQTVDAGYSVIAGQPVYNTAPDLVAPLAQSESAMLAFLGFALNGASAGQSVTVQVTGKITGLFTALALGDLYVVGSGPPVPYSAVPLGYYNRPVGTAFNPSSLAFTRGFLDRKGSFTMAKTPLAIDNTTGALVPDDNSMPLETGIAGAAISKWQAIYRDGAGLLYPLDGTQANVKSFVGISDAAYAAGATVSYAAPGGHLTDPAATMTPGDYWADDTGLLVYNFSALPSGTYTKIVANATSATEIVVVDASTSQTLVP